jgi:prepilin-type processing-associated H-X9-DG protein
MKSQNALKEIGLAIHNDYDSRGKLVGPIRDGNGKPLLSWRVAILPYLECDNLYRQFHLDEPWDSPYNLTLLDQMPSQFRSVVHAPPRPFWTFTRLVTGPGTAFERDGLKFPDIEGGVSQTIFVLEAGEAVPWTKPEEWEYDPAMPLPTVGGVFDQNGWFARRRGQHDGTNVLFGDGRVQFLPRSIPEATWRALIERNNNKRVELP